MEIDLTTEGTIKRGLFKDISNFLRHFNEKEEVSFEEFQLKWDEMDLGLLPAVCPVETIISCLIQIGLFGPTRPFRDHQLLVFILFSIFKLSRKHLKLSSDRIQFLLGLRMRAGMQNANETVEALECLFKHEAFVILAEEVKVTGIITHQNINSHAVASADQLLERIRRVDLFLQSHPLFDQKLSRNSLTRLKGLFERYYDAKKRNQINIENEQDFGTVMGSVMKIVEGYESLIKKFAKVPTPLTIKSIRSRLSHTSLTPMIPTASTSPVASLTADLFPSIPNISSRSQSVPVSRMRRSSSLKDINLDEFIESSAGSANMPNINFY